MKCLEFIPCILPEKDDIGLVWALVGISLAHCKKPEGIIYIKPHDRKYYNQKPYEVSVKYVLSNEQGRYDVNEIKGLIKIF